MTRRITRLPRPPRSLVTALLLSVAVLATPLVAACDGSASATEVRANGAVVSGAPVAAPATNGSTTTGPATAATPAARKSAGLIPPPSAPAPKQIAPVPAPQLSARAAIVVDDASGATLFEHNARTRIPPASLTKIATAALAIDKGKLDDWVDVTSDFMDPALDDASMMGLRQGDRFRLRDLIVGMLLPSGADAAITIGRAVSGSDAAFVKDLNAFMESLGLFDTHFVDPHGIGGPTHLTTAYDVAMLSRYAMRQPLFAQAARSEAFKAVGSRTIEVYNTNPWAFGYEGGDGVKSGFTEVAGPTLAASATRVNHRVFVVVLDSTRRNQDTTALMDWAFNTFCWNDGQLGCRPR